MNIAFLKNLVKGPTPPVVSAPKAEDYIKKTVTEIAGKTLMNFSDLTIVVPGTTLSGEYKDRDEFNRTGRKVLERSFPDAKIVFDAGGQSAAPRLIASNPALLAREEDFVDVTLRLCRAHNNALEYRDRVISYEQLLQQNKTMEKGKELLKTMHLNDPEVAKSDSAVRQNKIKTLSEWDR